jgi:hypothetical protein
VLLLLVALLVGAELTRPAATVAPSATPAAAPMAAQQVPVARAGAACPDPVVDQGTTTEISLAAPGARAAGGRPGSAVLTPTRPGSGDLARVVAPGAEVAEVTDPHPDDEDGPDGPGPVAARGTGRSAPGLVAAQLTRSTEATMRGLAGVTCAPSDTDAWFVGSGAVVGQRGRVYLTNIEAAPAVVDLTLYGPDGPIDAPDGRGVTIAPGRQEVRLLDALAPGTERFAVHVHARQGRIAAGLRDQQVDGLTPLGADWVPPALAPTHQLLVPGVPGGPGKRRLQVVAPGDSDGIVRVRLVSESGAFAPAGLDVIEVRAGTVTDVDIAPFASGEPVTVELDSDVPVTAGVLTELSGATGELGEIAYTAATAPLTTEAPGVVSDARGGKGVTSTLLLTAPEGAATVRLVPLGAAGGEPTEVRVSEGTQVAVDLATVSDAAAFALAVVPAPGSGPVLAVRQIDEDEERGPFITSAPVQPGRYVVDVPLVAPDLSTGLPPPG